MDSKYDLRTGDLLLFSQKGSCLSTLIKKCTKSKFSHVAIILKNPTNISPELKGYYILESSIEIKRDAVDNKKKFGVRIRKLKDAIANYNGSIYWRKLNCLRDDKFYLNIKMLYEDVRNILYDINPVDWFKAAFAIDIGDVHKKKTFWCSALVAYLYVKLGFLPECIPWTIITPNEFSSTGDLNDRYIKCNLESERLYIHNENTYTML
tara:strand:- start:195 stop:818 length:624 start_codon:yes stop_codon:yes gene_type:complete